MKLSIITINRNQRTGLAQTLASVEAQTFRDFEHIIIDGASDDGSIDEIRTYAERMDVRLSYWCSEQDSGIYNAMNKGLVYAQGDYVFFLNAGDLFYDACVLEKIFGTREWDADVIYGDMLGFDATRTSQMKYAEPLTLEFFYITSIAHQGSFTHRACFEGRVFDERFRIVSDWAFFLELFMEGARFVRVDEVICRYDMTGISSQAWAQRLQRRERTLVQQEKFSPEMRAICERNLILANTPRFLHPLLKSNRMLQHAAFRCANAVRFAQAFLR